MTPYQHARKFYGANWEDTLAEYCERHFVYASPTAIGLAKPEGDTWFIQFAAGDVKELLTHLPFWLPYINFNSKGVEKSYATAKLVNRFLRDDTVKNGHVDPLLRRRRRRWSGEASASTDTINGSGELGQDQDS